MRIPAFSLARQIERLKPELSAAVEAVMASGQFILGEAVGRFEEEAARWLGARAAIGVGNGSDALYLALRALEVGPGDEVIVPAFTFFATAGSVLRCGAKPVFTDIDLDTFNIEPGEALARVTPRTRAILPVHLFGLPADLGRLRAGFRGAIVEDAAQAFGAAWRGKKVGTLGDLAAFSFFPTKNLGGLGDGGMVTTDRMPWAESVRRLRVHGAAEKYRHETLGINSRLDALQAAALSVKLRYVDEWNRRRQALAARYQAGFRAYDLGEWVRWPTIPDGATHVFHQYTIRCVDRDALQRHLSASGIGSTVYYPIPLHLQPALREYGAGAGSLPKSEEAARTVLSLPMFPELLEEEVDQVVEAVAAFYGKA